MKNGRSLVNLAYELERQLHSKKDLIVPSTLMRHVTDDLGTTGLVIDEGGTPAHYGVTPLARRQLADKLKIPFAYFERMREAQPALLQPRATPGLIAALATEGALSAEEASALDAVHATFVADGLACTLDRRPRLVVENAALTTARAVVMRTTLAHGLPFDTP